MAWVFVFEPFKIHVWEDKEHILLWTIKGDILWCIVDINDEDEHPLGCIDRYDDADIFDTGNRVVVNS